MKRAAPSENNVICEALRIPLICSALLALVVAFVAWRQPSPDSHNTTRIVLLVVLAFAAWCQAIAGLRAWILVGFAIILSQTIGSDGSLSTQMGHVALASSLAHFGLPSQLTISLALEAFCVVLQRRSENEKPSPDVASVELVGGDSTSESQSSEKAASRWRRYARILVATSVLVVLVTYLVVLPTLQFALAKPGTKNFIVEEMTLREATFKRCMEFITISWFFALGASFGSFYKVLADRLPRGESVVAKPSYCPACGVRLRFRDNLPVLGWLLLKGECRDCRSAIPFEYLATELLFGGVFVLILICEVLSGGYSVPNRPIDYYAGVVWMIWYAKSPGLLGLYAYHTALIAFLILAWLFVRNRSDIPAFLIGLHGAVGVLLPLWFPKLHPVAAFAASDAAWPSSLSTSMLGLIAGAVGGWLLWNTLPRVKWKGRRNIVATMSVTGAFLGWQAVATIICVTFLGLVAARTTRLVLRRSWRSVALASFILSTCVFLCLWRPIHRWQANLFGATATKVAEALDWY